MKDHDVDDDNGNKDKWHRNDKFLSIFDLFNFVTTIFAGLKNARMLINLRNLTLRALLVFQFLKT